MGAMDALGPGAAGFMGGLQEALGFAQKGRQIKAQMEQMKQQTELLKAHQKIYDAQAQQIQQRAELGVKLQQAMMGSPEQQGMGPEGVDVYPGTPPNPQAATGILAQMFPQELAKQGFKAQFAQQKPLQPHAVGAGGLAVPDAQGNYSIIGAPQPMTAQEPTEPASQGMQWVKGINAKGQPTWRQTAVPQDKGTPQTETPTTPPAEGYQWSQAVDAQGRPTWHQVPAVKPNPLETRNIPDNVLYGIAEGAMPAIKLADGTLLDADAAKKIVAKKMEVQSAQGVGRAEAYQGAKVMPVIDASAGNQPGFATGKQVVANPGKYMPPGPTVKALNQTSLIEDIRGAINLTRDSLKNLKTEFTATQAAQLNIALNAPVNSGALDAFFASSIGKALTPEQIDYVTNLAQLKENAMAMRSILGAGQGSDELRAAITATLPSPRTPTRAYAATALDKFEGQINRLARGVPNVTLRTETGTAPAPAKPQEETKTLGGKTYIKRGGKWYEQ